MSFTISFHKYDTFYYAGPDKGFFATRLTLGWVTFLYIPLDMVNLLNSLVDNIDELERSINDTNRKNKEIT